LFGLEIAVAEGWWCDAGAYCGWVGGGTVVANGGGGGGTQLEGGAPVAGYGG